VKDTEAGGEGVLYRAREERERERERDTFEFWPGQ
jgi:hypothetical protein